MKRNKLWSRVFLTISIVLSHTMCIYVTYSWMNHLDGIKHGANSAPAYTTLIYAVPFIIAIVLCLLIGGYFKKISSY